MQSDLGAFPASLHCLLHVKTLAAIVASMIKIAQLGRVKGKISIDENWGMLFKYRSFILCRLSSISYWVVCKFMSKICIGIGVGRLDSYLPASIASCRNLNVYGNLNTQLCCCYHSETGTKGPHNVNP